MKLELQYDSANAIPDVKLADLYVEKDGKFVPKDSDLAKQISQPTELQTSLAKERKARAEAEKTLRSFKDRISDIGDLEDEDAISSLIEEVNDLRSKRDAGELDDVDIAKRQEEIAAAAEKRFAPERAKLERQLQTLQKDLDTTRGEKDTYSQKYATEVVRSQASSAAAKLKIRDGFQEDFLAQATRRFKPDEGGSLVDTDETGLDFQTWADDWVSARPGVNVEFKAGGAEGGNGGDGSGSGSMRMSREEYQNKMSHPDQRKELLGKQVGKDIIFTDAES